MDFLGATVHAFSPKCAQERKGSSTERAREIGARAAQTRFVSNETEPFQERKARGEPRVPGSPAESPHILPGARRLWALPLCSYTNLPVCPH